MSNKYSEILNINLRRGEYYEFSLTVETANFSFSGWSAKLQVKNNYGDTSAVITLNSGTEITLSGDTATIKFPSTATDVAEGQYFWDIMFTDPDGNNHYPRKGTFTVERRVTS